MSQTVEAPETVTPINHWIGGKPWSGGSGRSGPVFNPATGRQTGEVAFASVEDVDRAVAAAREAAVRGARSRSRSGRTSSSASAACSTSTGATSPRSSRPSTARSPPTRSARWPVASR